ncbi:MAG: hypothetical protein KDI79_24120 [Anaerolineae bacterium]|nr:hypothetical protein [Anaerolineae bacterium]
MSTHQSLSDNLKNRYDHLIAEVDNFRRQIGTLHAETIAKYRQALETLDTQYETLKMKFARLIDTSGDAFEQHQNEFEIYLTEMETHFQGIRTTLHGDSSIGWPEGQAVTDPEESIGWAEGQGHTQEHDSEGWPEGQNTTHKVETSEGWSEGFHNRS